MTVPRKVFADVIAPPIEFSVGSDVFVAAGTCPGKALKDVAKAAKLPPEEQLDALVGFLDQVLVPDSAARYADRFKSTTEPISLEQAAEHVSWLIEVYSQRPTGPSSSVLNGSATLQNENESSTGGQLPAVSTPTPSPHIGS